MLPDISLEHLVGMDKNLAKDRDAAAQKVASMENWPADSCSGRWYDKDKKLLLAAFADHIVEVFLFYFEKT